MRVRYGISIALLITSLHKARNMNRASKGVCASQSVESAFVFWLTRYLTLNPSMILGLMTPHEI